MRLSRWIAVSVLPCAAFISAARSFAPARDAAADHVRRHLDSVLVELRTANVAPLALDQQHRRARLITELAAYRNRGDFPHNYDFPGQLVPYFRDRETGALCAVGDLLAFTGRGDIVRRVVAANNNVRVVQLAGDSAFRAWLNDNGLTLAEAARIQVVYSRSVSPPQLAGTIAIAALAPVSALTSFGASVINLEGNADGHSNRPIVTGFVAGALSVATGIALLHSPDMPRGPGGIATTVGAAGLALSMRALHRREATERSEHATAAPAVSVSLAPTVDAGQRNGEKPSVGAMLAVRF